MGLQGALPESRASAVSQEIVDLLLPMARENPTL